MKCKDEFLKEHRLRASDIDLENLIGVFTEEMTKGLEGKESSLRMIPTYIEAENEFLTGVPVIAIDAGGTNFRTSLITFRDDGKLEIGGISNFRMPGLDGEISKEDFFQTIAGYIKPMVGSADRIGFCFSYPTEIYPERDGRLLQFCKEVQAPGVIGQLIGKNLIEALGTPDKTIVLLNDTVATLLAGKSASFNRTYDSFIGFILGTGTNTCYIEQNRNILKNTMLKKNGSQIINIESGSFGKAPRTDIDILFDTTTGNPGSYTFEKMFSGGYFGGLCLATIKAAAGEGMFSPFTAYNLQNINELSTEEAGCLLSNTGPDENYLSGLFSRLSREEKEICRLIIDNLIDRAARLVAANIAAVILKTGRGKSASRPILITIEGTTFYKLHNLKFRFETYLKEFFSGEQQRFYDFTGCENSSLIGAALAALII